MAQGMSNKDIARHLNIGLATAKTHVHNLLRKLKLQRRAQMASWIR
jgi:DNA-binding NarL/FixJ family response regulator